MQQILDELKKTIDAGFYYSALTLALTLPDICSQLEYGASSRTNYINWIDSHMDKEAFSVGFPNFEKVEFNGTICYALRCKVLHSISVDITTTDVYRKKHLEISELKLIKPGTIDGGTWKYHLDNKNNIFTASIDTKYLCDIIYKTVLTFYNNGHKADLDKLCYEIV